MLKPISIVIDIGESHFLRIEINSGNVPFQ